MKFIKLSINDNDCDLCKYLKETRTLEYDLQLRKGSKHCKTENLIYENGWKCVKTCPNQALSKGYRSVSYLEPQFTMLAVIIDYDKCKGCGECVSICPNNCLKLVKNKEEVQTVLI